jgi:mannan endo-1,4-beta-mannosidase
MRSGFIAVILAAIALLFSVQESSLAQTEITLPTYQGYISVSPNGRYFVDEAGQGFIVIGQNDGVPWPGLVTLLNNLSPEATENYIIDLREHGINVSRVMIEYSQAPHTYLENPVGTFSPAMVAFWDDFIALAERHGLYLLLTPYDTFWQAANWDRYPYNAALGGPCETRRDWLTSRPCIDAHKERWRFILERWGGSPNIMAWDIMNEIDIWWDATADEIRAYIDEMAVFIRETETAAWGRSRMLTVSSAASVPDGELGRIIYNHPLLDFANTHLYIGPDIKAPTDPIGAGPMMAGGVVLSIQAINDNRPYLDTESGPIDSWIGDPAFDAEYHHNMSWAHLAAGGAGSGMRWPYTTPHWILPEMRDNLLGLARFASQVDWANFPSQPITSNILIDDRNILRAGASDGRTAIVWLLLDTRGDRQPSFEGRTLMINRTFEDGDYNVQFWETYSGTPMQTVSVTVTGGQLRLELPAFDNWADLRDLALLITPQAN